MIERNDLSYTSDDEGARIVEPQFSAEDTDVEFSLRPRKLNEYIGQEKVKENLQVYIQAAKKRNESLDHVLLYGPPGLGKTTLAGIIANEMGVNFKVPSGPAIEKPGELAALLTGLQAGCKGQACFFRQQNNTFYRRDTPPFKTGRGDTLSRS